MVGKYVRVPHNKFGIDPSKRMLGASNITIETGPATLVKLDDIDKKVTMEDCMPFIDKCNVRKAHFLSVAEAG